MQGIYGLVRLAVYVLAGEGDFGIGKSRRRSCHMANRQCRLSESDDTEDISNPHHNILFEI